MDVFTCWSHGNDLCGRGLPSVRAVGLSELWEKGAVCTDVRLGIQKCGLYHVAGLKSYSNSVGKLIVNDGSGLDECLLGPSPSKGES